MFTSSLSPSVQTCLDTATDKLLEEGLAAALRFLIESQEYSDPAIQRRIHAIVNLHRRRIEAEAGVEFLQQSAFDPIFCQCSVCQREWTISPLLTSPTISPEALQPLITEINTKICPSCGKAYCRRCAATAGKTCTCGTTLQPLSRPNGRKRPQPQPKPDSSNFGRQREKFHTDAPVRNKPDLHLYFGKEGKVLIAIDKTFPQVQPAALQAHVDWAETLFNFKQYYQAEQQLDLLGEAANEIGKASWLRARLRWIQYRNLVQRRREHLTYMGFEAEHAMKREIYQLLEQATLQSPQDGQIWLTRAEASMEFWSKTEKETESLALKFALEAQAHLPGNANALFLEGKAHHKLGQYEAALTALRKIPSEAECYSQAHQLAHGAELALRCQEKSVDIQAHLELGYRLWMHNRRAEAAPLFQRLITTFPDSAESLFVQGLLMWFDFKHPERYKLTHLYYLQALEKKPDFGLVYQYLGILYHAIPYNYEELDYEPGDPVECYKRAVQLDPTCDLAWGEQGQIAIDQGDIPTALSLLEKAAALDTTDHSVYLNLSAIYLGHRQFEKQELAKQKAKELEPIIELKAEYVERILALCKFEY